MARGRQLLVGQTASSICCMGTLNKLILPAEKKWKIHQVFVKANKKKTFILNKAILIVNSQGEPVQIQYTCVWVCFVVNWRSNLFKICLTPPYCLHVTVLKLYGYPPHTWYTAQKMKFSIKDYFSKCDQIRKKLWTWLQTEEILNGKLHFLCSGTFNCIFQSTKSNNSFHSKLNSMAWKLSQELFSKFRIMVKRQTFISYMWAKERKILTKVIPKLHTSDLISYPWFPLGGSIRSG